MILEGSERGTGAQLAGHLPNPHDNDHVTVHTIEGFLADDLFGAFAAAEAISGATQCRIRGLGHNWPKKDKNLKGANL